jgi:hypothetical protein
MAQNPEDHPETGIIELNVNESSWVINGTTYFKAKRIGTERFQILERQEIQFGYAATFKGIFDKLVEAYNYGNQRKDLDLGVTLKNVLTGMTNVDNSITYAFEMCTLLLNHEGENLREYTEETRLKKLKDFKEGGIDAAFFFELAAKSVPGFLAAFNQIARGTLDIPKSES